MKCKDIQSHPRMNLLICHCELLTRCFFVNNLTTVRTAASSWCRSRRGQWNWITITVKHSWCWRRWNNIWYAPWRRRWFRCPFLELLEIVHPHMPSACTFCKATHAEDGATLPLWTAEPIHPGIRMAMVAIRLCIPWPLATPIAWRYHDWMRRCEGRGEYLCFKISKDA